MPADVLRLFVFARHAESVANAANMLNSNPSQPVALDRWQRQKTSPTPLLGHLRVTHAKTS